MNSTSSLGSHRVVWFRFDAALATVVGVLVEVPVMLPVVKIVNATGGRGIGGEQRPARVAAVMMLTVGVGMDVHGRAWLKGLLAP